MKKIITPLVDIVICTYIITACFICLTEFNNWQNKIIAVTITIGSAYIIAIALNRFLGAKIGVLSGVFNLLSGPLLIIGAIVCIALLDPWPVKIIGLFLNQQNHAITVSQFVGFCFRLCRTNLHITQSHDEYPFKGSVWVQTLSNREIPAVVPASVS